MARDTIYAMCQAGDSIGKNIGAFCIFDREGNHLSTQLFDIPTETNIGTNMNTLIKTRDGGFVYGGWSWGRTATDNSLILLKYDSRGNFQWYKQFADTLYRYLYCLAITQDSLSNYYLTGDVVHNSSGNMDIFLMKTDSAGNWRYMKVYNDPNLDDAATGICINKNGNIIISGGGSKYTIPDLTTYKERTKNFEVDTGGQIIRYFIGSDTTGPSASHIIPLYNGDYLTTPDHICQLTHDMVLSKGGIVQFDSTFHITHSNSFGPCSGWTVLYNLYSNLSGNYFASGRWYDETNSSLAHMNGWIINFDTTGTLVWSRLYRGVSGSQPGGDDNVLTSITTMSDGSIVAAGEATDNSVSINGQQAWLLHLDSAGCLPDSNTCGLIDGMPEVNSQEIITKAYPNPVSGELTVDYHLPPTDQAAQLEIFNQIGQKVYNEAHQGSEGSCRIDCRQWPSGLYLCRIRSEMGFTSSVSLIVEH